MTLRKSTIGILDLITLSARFFSALRLLPLRLRQTLPPRLRRLPLPLRLRCALSSLWVPLQPLWGVSICRPSPWPAGARIKTPT